MIQPTGHVEGVLELRDELAKLEPKVSKGLMRKALRAGAKVIQRRCISDAPVRTGITRDAIKVKAGKRKAGRISMLVSVGKQWFSGPTFYAGFVNFGWKTGKRGSKNRRQIEGTRWLQKAFNKSASTAVNVIVSTLKEGLKQAMAGKGEDDGGNE